MLDESQRWTSTANCGYVEELHPAREYSVPENAQLKIIPAIMGEFIQRFCENM